VSYFRDPELEKILTAAEVVVFDMNGLIVDDEPIQLQAVNEVLQPYQIQLNETDWIQKCVGRSPLEYFQKMLVGSVWNLEKWQALCEAKELAYEKLIGQLVVDLVRPGFLDFFRYLTQSPKYKIALATSTARRGMEIILGENGLNLFSHFDFTVCGDDVQRAKPDPEIYLNVRQFFSTKKRFLVFEDSAFGVESAILAGCECVAVPNIFTQQQDLSKATILISNFLSE